MKTKFKKTYRIETTPTTPACVLTGRNSQTGMNDQ